MAAARSVGQTILDVGAGTGLLTLELVQRCGPETKILAVDPWNAGMHRLRRKLAHLDLSNVLQLEQDAAAADWWRSMTTSAIAERWNSQGRCSGGPVSPLASLH